MSGSIPTDTLISSTQHQYRRSQGEETLIKILSPNQTTTTSLAYNPRWIWYHFNDRSYICRARSTNPIPCCCVTSPDRLQPAQASHSSLFQKWHNTYPIARKQCTKVRHKKIHPAWGEMFKFATSKPHAISRLFSSSRVGGQSVLPILSQTDPTRSLSGCDSVHSLASRANNEQIG